MSRKIIDTLHHHRLNGRKSLAVLLDPDKLPETKLSRFISLMNSTSPDFILVGGSLISSGDMEKILTELSEKTFAPKIIFPGNGLHVFPQADGILLLSLISGRNAEFLIGQHVISAPALRRSGLEILPTGYILVDGGKPTTVSYISNTTPVPHDKPDVAACTAMAGEMLGLKLIYLDAGSGARQAVSPEMIREVRKATNAPLMVGGGIDTAEKASAAFSAGADTIVIGNALEKDPDFLLELAEVVRKHNYAIA